MMTTQEAGQRGGQARSQKLSASRRQEIARLAARKRWGMLSGKQESYSDVCDYRERASYCATHKRWKYICDSLISASK